jgi:hypothetical protein
MPSANLILCPDCQKDVSRKAPACPHCGCPIRGWATTIATGIILSWVFTVILFVGVVYLLVAIGIGIGPHR